MKRIIISVIFCLAIVVFGIHTSNAAEPLKNCGADPMRIDIGDIIECSVNVAKARNFYFYAFSGDKIRLTMTDMTSGSAAPYLALYDPDGVRLHYWYVQDRGTHGEYDLKKDGKYTIVVWEYADDQAVDFRIALQGILPSPPEARTLKLNSYLDGEIDPVSDTDVFIFEGNIGDKIRLTMTDMTSGSPAPYLALYDPDGVRLHYWYVQDRGTHGEYDLKKDGTYTIVVWEYADDQAVSYRLGFHCILGKCFECRTCLPFEDVCNDHWAYKEIMAIYNAGITTGCSTNPLKYCPLRDVNRAQMAVFLERGINDGDYTPPPASGIFDDVPVTHWAADWIEQLYKDGITTGCAKSPLKYCPDRAVNRAQMAVFLLRSKHGENYTPPKAAGIFDDVPVTYWAADWIEQLYKEGVTTGCSTNPLKYCPLKEVNRAQMAVFLTRTFGL